MGIWGAEIDERRNNLCTEFHYLFAQWANGYASVDILIGTALPTAVDVAVRSEPCLLRFIINLEAVADLGFIMNKATLSRSFNFFT
jgi:hypothetical protein